jgi:hypothetical protein
VGEFIDSDGNYIAIKSTVDDDGDTIFEADDSVKFISCEEWLAHLFEEIANSGAFVSNAYGTVMARYRRQFGEFEMTVATPEVIESILDYMNELHEDALSQDDEEDSYYKEEPFTDENIGI